jgi:sterol desaturase/sphingolipid hydroxylase (fatty acid hydroxylase superfamily)
MGADRIPWSHADSIQSNAPELILWSIPVIVTCVLIEIYLSHRLNKGYYQWQETLGSLWIGIGNITISSLIKVGLFYGAIAIYNFLLWRMELNWWSLIPCYILFDFCSYWAHRISHSQRFWWATHVTHHSGEHYNLSVAFRLSWFQYLKIIFLFPVPLMGFHPIIFFVANQAAILFQFWVHTEFINRLPAFFEYVFVTPSNHRVHHGSQPHYLDKNFGATFIVWDRLFGTYQKEIERPQYGITTSVRVTSNPFYLNFHEYTEIFKDVKSAKGWRQKLFFIFGSPAKIASQKMERSSGL